MRIKNLMTKNHPSTIITPTSCCLMMDRLTNPEERSNSGRNLRNTFIKVGHCEYVNVYGRGGGGGGGHG